MKTALLHYWLTNRRGGEKVFRALCGLFPDGDVFTHAYNAAAMGDWFAGRDVRESFVGWLPFARTRCQAYLPLMPAASRSFRLDGYDLLVSSESGPIKGVRKPSGAKHVCYCHTPMRYLWDMYDDYRRMAGVGGKIAMRLFRDYLRKEDLRSADAVDEFVANSRFVAERVKRIYGRDATVVHPFVDDSFFSAERRGKGDFYLLAGQLVAYKRPDLAVRACLKANRRLKVVGAGGEIGKLRRLAAGNANVEFLGRVDAETLRRCYAGARALLFPGVEDFGIVPLEAQASGTPVIAYGKGGALETVRSGETGVFFGVQETDAVCGAMEAFEGGLERSSAAVAEACRANARKFGKREFEEGMRAVFARVGCAASIRAPAASALVGIPPVGGCRRIAASAASAPLGRPLAPRRSVPALAL